MSDSNLIPLENEHKSEVNICDVTACTFNAEHECHAGAIHIAFVDGMAHCETYTPREGDASGQNLVGA
jgi:hypothetical protein